MLATVLQVNLSEHKILFCPILLAKIVHFGLHGRAGKTTARYVTTATSRVACIVSWTITTLYDAWKFIDKSKLISMAKFTVVEAIRCGEVYFSLISDELENFIT